MYSYLFDPWTKGIEIQIQGIKRKIYIKTISVIVDGDERIHWAGTTSTGGNTYFGCPRCIGKSFELIDDHYKHLPYHNLRSPVHYDTWVASNRDKSVTDMKKMIGYNPSLYHRNVLSSTNNVHLSIPIDVHHNTMNLFNQVDECLKCKNWLNVCYYEAIIIHKFNIFHACYYEAIIIHKFNIGTWQCIAKYYPETIDASM